jgi:isocitrate/isopropylmalate dehydrogenase
MRSQKKFTVACLSGDGIGPELMAELVARSPRPGRLHRFRVEEQHVPFAGEAVSRYDTRCRRRRGQPAAARTPSWLR